MENFSPNGASKRLSLTGGDNSYERRRNIMLKSQMMSMRKQTDQLSTAVSEYEKSVKRASGDIKLNSKRIEFLKAKIEQKRRDIEELEKKIPHSDAVIGTPTKIKDEVIALKHRNAVINQEIIKIKTNPELILKKSGKIECLLGEVNKKKNRVAELTDEYNKLNEQIYQFIRNSTESVSLDLEYAKDMNTRLNYMMKQLLNNRTINEIAEDSNRKLRRALAKIK